MEGEYVQIDIYDTQEFSRTVSEAEGTTVRSLRM